MLAHVLESRIEVLLPTYSCVIKSSHLKKISNPYEEVGVLRSSNLKMEIRSGAGMIGIRNSLSAEEISRFGLTKNMNLNS